VHAKVRIGHWRGTIVGSVSPLFEDAIIECIAEAYDPTVKQLFTVAARIWTDGAAERSVFDWDKLPTQSVERLMAVRAAQLALCGTLMVQPEAAAIQTDPVKTSANGSDSRELDAGPRGVGERHIDQCDRTGTS
jgi:hypothetical protein